ncbi:hypothetical protein ABZ671_04490 [Micromonospora sp. NPDC006766]|uniref:hypothetical protein n=1 Tax=Micromonospora sp. NPDC006766 TaxID=3154778 RepID=UPI0033DC9129
MTTDLDRALRDAFERIGDEPAPVGVAPAVVSRVRRQGRVRVALSTGALVALVAVGAPLGVRAAGGQNEPFSAGSPGGQTVQLGAGSPTCSQVVTAYSFTGRQPPRDSLLRDDATGEYVELPYHTVVPSPDGSRVLVRRGEDTPASPLRWGILDPANLDHVRWIGSYGSDEGSWSPDGKEILFTVRERLHDKGFAIVDAVTLKDTFVKLNFYAGGNTGAQDFVWAPGGNEVALTVSQSAGSESLPDQVTGIRFYNRSGKLTHTIPATAALGSAQAFSPDGSRIALQNVGIDAPIRIVATATGAAQQTIPLSGEFIAWADDEHLVLRSWPDDRKGSEMQVVDLAGRVTQVIPLRADVVNASPIFVACK